MIMLINGENKIGKAIGGPLDGNLIYSDLVHLVRIETNGGTNLFHEYWYVVPELNYELPKGYYEYQGVLIK